MAGLFHSLNVGAESLYNARQGVDTTGHNISNAQTEGYSRQRINLENRDPLLTHGIIIGNGAYVHDVQRIHDKFVEGQVNRANQQLGSSQARFEALKGLESIFSPELDASVSDELNGFFNALRDLANDPQELAARTGVRESALNLSKSINRVDNSLRTAQSDINEQISNEVSAVNDLIQNIASLNTRIGEMESGGRGEANDLRDERDKMVRNLAGKMEISYYEIPNRGLVIRGPAEIPLIEGKEFGSLALTRNRETGFWDVNAVDFEGQSQRNITTKMEEGRIAALIGVRDGNINALIDKNNEIAHAVTTNVNEVHAQGFGIGDFRETAGRNFFEPIGDIKNAAQSMKLTDAILSSTDAISAGSTPNAPGDNLVANNLIRLKDSQLLDNGNATVTEFYASMVGGLGLEITRADHIKEADKVLQTDLNSKRESISGVSLDEEATNLMRWQACFTASSKLITTVDEMLDTVLSLKR